MCGSSWAAAQVRARCVCACGQEGWPRGGSDEQAAAATEPIRWLLCCAALLASCCLPAHPPIAAARHPPPLQEFELELDVKEGAASDDEQPEQMDQD